MLRIISAQVNPQAIEQAIGGLGGGMMAGRAEKIQQYVARIQNGEPKEQVLQGLPPSMIQEVEQQLQGSMPLPPEIANQPHAIPIR